MKNYNGKRPISLTVVLLFAVQIFASPVVQAVEPQPSDNPANPLVPVVAVDSNSSSSKSNENTNQDTSTKSNDQTNSSTDFLGTSNAVSSSVPAGWTTTQSNPNFAWKTVDQNSNTTAYLLNLQTNQEYVAGYGSSVRHQPIKVDVSPDSTVALVAYHESGPIVGQLSWVELHRMQDILDDPVNGYKQPERTVFGVYVSHSFTDTDVTVSTMVYDESTPDDPNDTKIVTVTILLSEITGIPAPSNGNFSFSIVTTQTGQDVYLINNQTGQIDLITTAQPSETVAALDVDPTGKYAFVNVQRTLGSPGQTNYRVTGDLLIFDTANKVLVNPQEVIGGIPGQNPMEGRIVPRNNSPTSYLFVNGLALLNMTLTYGTGSGNITSNWGVILNLNITGLRYTRAPVTSIFLDSAVLFTPQGDKLLFGAEENGPGANGVGIYDTATGTVSVRSLANYGFGGIKAVSPDGNYVVAASNVNTVYIVPIRNLSQSTQTVTIPVPPGESVSNYTLVHAKFLTSTLVELTVRNGSKYYYEIQTSVLVPSEIFTAVLNFYGGTLPPGSRILYSRPLIVQDHVVGWDVIVSVNQSVNQNSTPTIDNQLISLQLINNNWRIQLVLDRNANTAVANNVFVYNDNGSLAQIVRYNGQGYFLSRIHVKRPLNAPPYYEIVTKSHKRATLPIHTPIYIVLIEAALLEQ